MYKDLVKALTEKIELTDLELKIKVCEFLKYH